MSGFTYNIMLVAVHTDTCQICASIYLYSYIYMYICIYTSVEMITVHSILIIHP